MKCTTTADGGLMWYGNPDGYWISLPARQKPAVSLASEVVGEPVVNLSQAEVGLAQGHDVQAAVRPGVDGGIVPTDQQPVRLKVRVEDEDGRFCSKRAFSLCVMLQELIKASHKRPGGFVGFKWNDGAWVLREDFEGSHVANSGGPAGSGKKEVAA